MREIWGRYGADGLLSHDSSLRTTEYRARRLLEPATSTKAWGFAWRGTLLSVLLVLRRATSTKARGGATSTTAKAWGVEWGGMGRHLL